MLRVCLGMTGGRSTVERSTRNHPGRALCAAAIETFAAVSATCGILQSAGRVTGNGRKKSRSACQASTGRLGPVLGLSTFMKACPPRRRRNS